MAWAVPILLLAWPALEIAIFIEVARWLGLLGAIGGIVASGLIGFALLRRQSLATARTVQGQLNHGELPVGALFDAACQAVAGLLFLLPGFLTDLLAAALLIPPVRRLLLGVISRRLRAAGAVPPERKGPTTIEGEWVVVDRDEDHPNDPPLDPPRLPG